MSTRPDDLPGLSANQGQQPDIEDFLGPPPINPVENLRTMREETEARFGAPTQLPSAEAGLIETDPTMRRLTDEGVDITTGVQDAQMRIKLAFQRDDRRKQFLDQQFGPGQWREVDDQVVVRNRQGDELLLDEYGLSVGDIADAADLVVEGAGAALGGFGAARALARPAVSTLAAASAIGSQAVGGLAEFLTQVGPANFKKAKEIAVSRTPDAAMEFLMGAAGGKLMQFASRQPVETGELTTKGIVDARNRLQGLLDPEGRRDLPLSAGAITQNPTIQRGESIGEKLPFSGELFKKRRTELETGINELTARMKGPEDASEDIVRRLNANRDVDRDRLRAMDRQFNELVQGRIDEVGAGMDPKGAALRFEDVGTIQRANDIRRRDAFTAQSDSMFKSVDALPGGSDPVVSPQGMGEAIKEALESTATKGGKPAEVFIPGKTRAFIDALPQLDTMTLRQARNARSDIWDQINTGEAVGDQNSRILKKIAGAISDSIDEAVEQLPAETGDALRAANEFYKSNIDQFQQPWMAPSFVRTGPGSLSDLQLAQRTILSGDRDIVKASLETMNREQRGTIARSIFNEVLDQGRATGIQPGRAGDNVYDAEKLWNALKSNMPRGLADEFLGENTSNEVYRVLQAMQAKTGKLDLDLANALIEPDAMVDSIRQAARQEAKIVKDYEKGPVKEFITDATGQSALEPDDFIPKLKGMTEANIRFVMDKIRDTPEEALFANATAQDLFKKSVRSAGIGDGAVGLGLEILDGKNLTEALSNLGDRKLRLMLGADGAQVMKDLATVQLANQTRAGSQAGGLIAGGLLGVMFATPVAGAQLLAKFRVMAELMTSKKVVRALTFLKLRSERGPFRATTTRQQEAAAVVAGAFANGIREEFGDDPKTANLFLSEANKIMPSLEFNPKPDIADVLGEP